MKRLAQMTALMAVLFMLPGIGTAVAVPGAAASQRTSTKSTNKKGDTAGKMKAAKGRPAYRLATAEDLSGTIKRVGPAGRVLTLIGSNGVPYDFDLTGHTQIQIQNGQQLSIAKLTQDLNQHASVHFVPMSNGNRAQTIEVQPS